jgi:hypothetical protein
MFAKDEAVTRCDFAFWNPSLTEEAVFQIAEGLEQVAKGPRNLAASAKLPAK